MQAFYTCFMKFCLALNSYKLSIFDIILTQFHKNSLFFNYQLNYL